MTPPTAARIRTIGAADRSQQLVVLVECPEPWELGDHVRWRAKEEPGIGGVEHRRVVVRVAGRDHAEVQSVQCLHRLSLLIGLAEVVVHDSAGCIGFEAVAEDRRPAELAHEGLGKLVEGVRQDDQLEVRPDPIEELGRTVERLHPADDLLNVGQSQVVLAQDGQPLLHEFVVVRDVPGRESQFVDASAFGEVDPDLGNDDPFEVEAGELQCGLQLASQSNRAARG